MVDVIIFSRSWEEHLDHPSIVLDHKLASGPKLKFKTFIFAASKLKRLGSVMSEAGVHPDPEKVMAMHRMPAPQYVAGVRSYMGVANYAGHLILVFSKRAAPLHKLTCKAQPFVWDETCRPSFEKPKGGLRSDLMLRLPV